MRRTVLVRVLLLVICVMLVTPRLGAIDTNKGSLVIDIGIGYGPKCLSLLPVILAFKYFVADHVALEVFVPGVVLLLFLARPEEHSSTSDSAAPSPPFGLPIGVEVNYYPPFFKGYGYLNVGLSYTESTLWAINANLGINTNEFVEINTDEDELDRTLEAYLESGVALMLPKAGLEISDFSDYSGIFLPDFSKRFLPNIELGLKFGGPLQ